MTRSRLSAARNETMFATTAVIPATIATMIAKPASIRARKDTSFGKPLKFHFTFEADVVKAVRSCATSEVVFAACPPSRGKASRRANS